MSDTAVRTLGDVELPAPGVWEIDAGHTEVGFIGRHFGLTKVRGRFTGVTGFAVIADDPAESTLSVSIDMATVTSGDQARDDHLRSPDFFDVENHPSAAFVAQRVLRRGATASVVGDLQIRDVTRSVTLDVEYLGHAADPWGNDRAVFSASATINREDWGLTWNMLLETGGFIVSKEIRLEIEAELIRRQP
ncbi:MAG: YceI family protein [Ilumatobacter sp.]|nr:YceI family protein [Ilumatobacter sp.]